MMEGKQLTVGSLFSGIGGLDLGLERAGMRVIWQSEIDPFACKVLAKHWPDVPNLGNIKDIDWSQVERPDVICGGYPCQPFSMAGKRKGEEDERHLWPWVREAIRILRPRYAILENVRGHLSLGGTTVVGEIASLGYDAEWRVVSAASVGANHRRDRIIIVAYPQSERGDGINNHPRDCEQSKTTTESGNSGRSQDVAYPDDDGCASSSFAGSGGTTSSEQPSGEDDTTNFEGRSCSSDDVAYTKDNRPQDECQPIGSEQAFTKFGSDGTDVSDSSSRVNVRRIRERGDDRGEVFGWGNLSRGATSHAVWEWWQVEPEVGRVAHGVPSRVDRLRGLGNAVVPQVAEVIGRLVVNAHETRCEGF